jgi:hypothetical protein
VGASDRTPPRRTTQITSPLGLLSIPDFITRPGSLSIPRVVQKIYREVLNIKHYARGNKKIVYWTGGSSAIIRVRLICNYSKSRGREICDGTPTRFEAGTVTKSITRSAFSDPYQLIAGVGEGGSRASLSTIVDH